VDSTRPPDRSGRVTAHGSPSRTPTGASSSRNSSSGPMVPDSAVSFVESNHRAALVTARQSDPLSESRQRTWSVFVVDLKTGRSRRLVHRVDYGGISWSPTGSSIGYLQRRRLYVAAGNGTRRRRLANLVVWGLHSWSPDGSVIAAEHHQGPADNRRSDIYLVRVKGRGVQRLTHGTDRNAEDLAADWSADGTKLSFTSDRDIQADGPRELYVVNADGSCETRLTRGAYALGTPAWQPGRSSGPPARCTAA
jgi:Tol biopolymer transport system component